MNLFRKLFGLENGVNGVAFGASLNAQMNFSLSPGLQVGQRTDVGRQRENNQDALYTLTSFIASDGQMEPFGLFIVADGMGGHARGEKASAIATRTAADYILRNLYLPEIVPDPHSLQDPINEVLITAVSKANQEVIEQSPNSGTTLTVAVLLGHHAYFAHVGDSRAYIYDTDQLAQVTKDHSWVAYMLESGQLTPEEALIHPKKNVLIRAIGQANTISIDTYLHTVPANSYLLICSDGLWNLVTDEEINQHLYAITSLDDCVNDLVDLANQKGGDDNISVVLVGVGPEVT